MIQLSVSIPNLDGLRSNFSAAPAMMLKYLAAATKASVFEVQKQAVDRNFRFKTPRAMRTGYLSLSFGYGIRMSASGLRGSIGPTAQYAPYVYFGTSRGTRPNPYMDRVAKAATPAVNRHFEDAAQKIAKTLADV